MDIRRAAIVGAGPGGLLGFIALQAAGVPAAEIDVFDPGPPLAVWRESMSAIAQRGMRSESDGHFYITDFPGLALIDTVRRRSARPLLQSAINRYHPDIDLVLDQGTALARHYGLEHR
ncbi:MAG: hypothetical protein ACRDFS_11530, partial [Chloroflexota bacterium]